MGGGDWGRNGEKKDLKMTSQLVIFRAFFFNTSRTNSKTSKVCGFEPHRHHCVVSLSKNINPSLVLVQPRKTRPFITERLLMGRKESNQTNKQTNKQTKVVK